MPDKPPPEFRALAETKTTAFLERSLDDARKQAESGDPTWQNMVRWTEEILKERATTENQLVLGADGHTYTQRQYREKRVRDHAQAELGALTGNFASALAFELTDDPHLAGLVGGLFSAAGGTAKGYNQHRQMTEPGPLPVSPPSGSPPPRGVEPPSRSEQSSSHDTGNESASPGAMGAGGPVTWADLVTFAQAVYALPPSVVAAARELTAQGVPPDQDTADLLSLLFAASGETTAPDVSIDDASDEPVGSPEADDASDEPVGSPEADPDEDVDSDPGEDGASNSGHDSATLSQSLETDASSPFDMEAYHRAPEAGETTAPEIEPGTGPLSNEAFDQRAVTTQHGSGGEGSDTADPAGESYAPASDELGTVSEQYAPASDELDVASPTGGECPAHEEDGQHDPASDELHQGAEPAESQPEQAEPEQEQYEQEQYEQEQYEQEQYEHDYEQVQYEQVQ